MDLRCINTQIIKKLTKSLAVTASELLPSNLFALKTAFLSQSVQYIQSSNNVILNGCFNFSGEYNITLKTKEIYHLLIGQLNTLVIRNTKYCSKLPAVGAI